jgi:predicted small lipoprotein YifL
MKLKHLSAVLVMITLVVSAAACGRKAVPPLPPTPSATQAEPSASPETMPPSSPSVSPSPSGVDPQEALSGFYALLKSEGNEKAALDALRTTLPGLPTDTAVKAVLAMEAYQDDAVMTGALVGKDLVDMIQKAMPEPYDEKVLADLHTITDTGLRKALQEFYSRGYSIVIPEGNYQAVINYDAYKDFEAALTPDLAAYIEIRAKESESRMAEDGGIIIPIDEVYARAKAGERFLKSFPQSVKAEWVDMMYHNYVDAFIFGFDNTPAFDYTTKTLKQDFLDSYELVAESADSAIAKAMPDYLKVLKENGYKLTQAVTDYRDNLYATLTKAPA